MCGRTLPLVALLPVAPRFRISAGAIFPQGTRHFSESCSPAERARVLAELGDNRRALGMLNEPRARTNSPLLVLLL